MQRQTFDSLVTLAKNQSFQASGPVYAELAKAEAMVQQAAALDSLARALDKLAEAQRRNNLPR